MGDYLKLFETFADTSDYKKITIHYRIDFNNRLTLIKTVDVPDINNPADGNITIVFTLKPISSVPTAVSDDEDFPVAHLTKDWRLMPQPHKITIILVHDKGSDEESMPTTDPS